MASEHQEQCAVVRWFDMQHPDIRGRLFAIPNGGQRHKAVAAKLKAEGVRKGVPDLFLPIPAGGYCGLFIELKAGKNRATSEQREWLEFLASVGYMAMVCVGADEAIAAIRGYMKKI